MQLAARLVDTPEWDALWRVFDEIQSKHWTAVAHDLATMNRRPDYETLQWQRGFFACGQRMRREAARALLTVSDPGRTRPEEDGDE